MLRFSAPGLLHADAAPLRVVEGAPSALRVADEPGDARASRPFARQPRVLVVDSCGNLAPSVRATVRASVAAFAVRPDLRSSIALLGSTALDASDGAVVFTDLRLDVATLFCRLEFSATALAPATSKPFPVAASAPAAACADRAGFASDCGPAEQRVRFLRVADAPAEAAANETLALPPRVELRTLDGLLVANSSGTVLAAVVAADGAPAGTLAGARAPLEAGVARFTEMRILALGAGLRLRFRLGSEFADSPPFAVVTGDAATLAPPAIPPQLVAGDAFPALQVDVRDAGGNRCGSAAPRCATVRLEAAVRGAEPPLAWEPAELAGANETAVAAGAATFAGLSAPQPGTYRLSFQCLNASGAASAVPVVSVELGVLPYGIPVRVEVARRPGGLVAAYASGAALQLYRLAVRPLLRLVDAGGNQVYGFTGHFGVEKAPGSATEVLVGAGNLLTQRAEWGQAEVDLSMLVQGASLVNDTVTMQYISSCCSILSAAGKNVGAPLVVSARPASLAVELPAGGVQSGEPFTLTLKISSGAPLEAESYEGIVSVALVAAGSTGPAAASLAGTTQRLARGGTVRLPGLTVSAPGTFDLRASATAPGLHEAPLRAGAPLVVALGPARGLRVATPPAGCLGGQACSQQPAVQLVDAAGNAVAQAGVAVTATVVSGTTGLVGSASSGTDAAGRAAFAALGLLAAGLHTVRFSGGAGALVAEARDVAVAVGPALFARVLVAPRESGLVAGLPFVTQPIAYAADAGSNYVAGVADTALANFTLFECGAGRDCSFFGPLQQYGDAGVFNFSGLGVRFAGEVRAEFRLESAGALCGGGSCWSFTDRLSVATGVPTHLFVASATPQHVCAAVAIAPAVVVHVRDASGNVVASPFEVSVVAARPGAGLAGAQTVAAPLGVATFDDISLARSCFHFDPAAPFAACHVLRFTSGAFTVESPAFTVIAGPAVGIAFGEAPESSAVGQRVGTPRVYLVDAEANPVLPLPADVAPGLCGAVSTLQAGSVTLSMAQEQQSGLALLLGQREVAIDDSAALFSGPSVNWEVPMCHANLTCTVSAAADNRIMRLRASAATASMVADSATFSVDVGQPTDFVAAKTNASAVFLRWRVPAHGPTPRGYALRLRYRSDPPTPWETHAGLQATAFTVGGARADVLLEAELCSETLLGGAGCAAKPPAPLRAAAIEPVTDLRILFATEHRALLRWAPAAAGVAAESFRVTAQEFPGGLETVVLEAVASANATVTGLVPSKAYHFRVYPKSPAGAFHAPTGPVVGPLQPVAAAEGVQVGCPAGGCTGSDVELRWAAPSAPQHAPPGVPRDGRAGLPERDAGLQRGARRCGGRRVRGVSGAAAGRARALHAVRGERGRARAFLAVGHRHVHGRRAAQRTARAQLRDRGRGGARVLRAPRRQRRWHARRRTHRRLPARGVRGGLGRLVGAPALSRDDARGHRPGDRGVL